MRDLQYIASTLFTRVKYTRVLTSILRRLKNLIGHFVHTGL